MDLDFQKSVRSSDLEISSHENVPKDGAVL